MLLSFRAANHKSLRDEQELLLVPVEDPDAPDAGETRALTVAGIFGANASGKSNVLDALQFMEGMVTSSMTRNPAGEGIEREAFALRAAELAEPSTYAVDLLLDGERYEYGFAIDDVRVVEEWMYRGTGDAARVVFERSDGEYRFAEDAPEAVQQVRDITEDNALFLSVAARTRQEAVRPVHDWFSHRLRFSLGGWDSDFLLFDPTFRNAPEDDASVRQLEALLRAADTGIERLERRRRRRIRREEAAVRASVLSRMSEQDRKEHWEHLEKRSEIVFHHHASETGLEPLRMHQESRGTRRLFDLGLSVLDVLRSGDSLFVDELDAQLHPHVSAKVIELFTDPDSNPRGAQLVFTSHDAALLGWIRGREVLRREEVWLVEKDKEGATRLFPLSDYEDQGGEDRARWYLTGRYGGTPEVADSEFDAAVARPGEGDEPA